MIYLPAFEATWTLSGWTGRPDGLVIDPIGVEVRIPAPQPKRRWWGGRRPAEPDRILHLVTHHDMAVERIQSWAMRQLAIAAALEKNPHLYGEWLTTAADEQAEEFDALTWKPTTVAIDSAPHQGLIYQVSHTRWAIFIVRGEDRIALISDGVGVDQIALRSATDDEARQLRADALRV